MLVDKIRLTKRGGKKMDFKYTSDGLTAYAR